MTEDAAAGRDQWSVPVRVAVVISGQPRTLALPADSPLVSAGDDWDFARRARKRATGGLLPKDALRADLAAPGGAAPDGLDLGPLGPPKLPPEA